MKGPFAIVCRAHSGGRVLSEAFIRNNIQMGTVNPRTKDTSFFAIRSNRIIRKLVEDCYLYPKMDEVAKRQSHSMIRTCIDDYIKSNKININNPFGWKFGETLFVVPVLLDAFPCAKVIHLIRDGRDVMLSRIPSRFEEKINEEFNELIIFGPDRKTPFIKDPFDSTLVSQYRNELEILHWNTCINFGFHCRKYENQYLEIKYEDFCINPIEIMNRICDFINIPLLPECVTWLNSQVNTTRIGKWRTLHQSQLKLPMEIAEKTLQQLGYK